MSPNRRLLALLIALGTFCSLAGAQSDSGPKVGENVPDLKVLAVTGDSAGKEVDLATLQKDATALTLLVAADKFDRPTARFMRELDQQLIKRDRRDVQIVAVWLTADVDKSKDHLPRIQQSLQLSQTTWTVYPGDRTGPMGWQIDADRTITIVASRSGKVLFSSGFDSINETLVDRILEPVLKAK